MSDERFDVDRFVSPRRSTCEWIYSWLIELIGQVHRSSDNNASNRDN